MATNLSATVNWTATILGEDRFPNIPIENPAQMTNHLEITTSIHSLFVTGIWNMRVLSDYGQFLSQNIFSVGTKIRFVFAPEGSTIATEVILSILSINNSGGGGKYEGMQYDISLVSPWYFDQIVVSRAYSGTASDIITQIVNEELSDSFTSVNIEKSIDNSFLAKYRTFQSPSRFFDDNLIHKARGDKDTAMFLYTTLKNELRLFSFNSMAGAKRYISAEKTSPLLSKFSSDMNDPEKGKLFFMHFSLMLNLNESENHALWALTNPAMTFMVRSDSSLKDASSFPQMLSLTNNIPNPFVYVSSTKFKGTSSYNKHYVDDSMRAYDTIYSDTVQKYTRDLMKEQKMIVSGFANFDIEAGYLCDVLVESPLTGTPDSISQTFMIERVSYTITANRAQSFLYMGTPAFHYKEASRVSQLYTRS